MLTSQSADTRIPITATLAVAVSACLLFAIEPFTGKVLLPRLGGTPSVWNTCVMVFQALLLAGYGYSVLVVRLSDRRKAVILHAALVALSIAIWPIAVRSLWLTPKPGWPPVLWIAATTIAGIGLPFVLLSATSPLLQVWLARSSTTPLEVHRLYAASNIASIVGLAAYVGALEPYVGVGWQSALLWAGYAIAMALALLVARSSRAGLDDGREPRVGTDDALAPPVSGSSRTAWIAISFGASLCLYAVTTYITTDVASFPLLWCVPLGLFLLSFAAGFSGWADRFRKWLVILARVVALAALAQVVWVEDSRTIWVGLLAPLLTLSVLVTALSAELAHRRPANDRLAGYYAWIGLGGVLAGTICVIVLPWAWSSFSAASLPLASKAISFFDAMPPIFVSESVPEYAAALVFASWLLSEWKSGRVVWHVALSVLLGVAVAVAGVRYLSPTWEMPQRIRIAGVAVSCAAVASAYGTRLLAATLALALVGGIVRLPERQTLFEARNFFGTSRVELDGDLHMLKHGTTLHGIQPIGSEAANPASYYSWASPLGRVMGHLSPQHVLAVGLGVGTVAAYGRPGDQYRFLEINPLVPRIATNPQWFTYVTDARSRGVNVDIVIGDGRLLAAELTDGSWDLIVVDAFSSDAIPVHLLSLEAVDLFRQKLSPRGVIAYHISNRFFDLQPLLSATATRLGLAWAVQSREGLTATDYRSTWVMMAKTTASAQDAGLGEAGWEQPAVSPTVTPWTDDWADVLGTMRSWKFWKKDED